MSGRTGRVVAEQLLGDELPVRALVRNPVRGREWADRGAEVVPVDLRSAAALAEALSGADAAWLLVPPDVGGAGFVDGRVSVAESLAEAVRASGIPRVVVLSSIGAQHASGTGPIVGAHRMEALFRDVPGVTFLRAAWFVENWLPALDIARTEGLLPVFQAADRPHPMVCAQDIGRAGAELMLSDDAPRVVELAGADDPTPHEVAAALGELLDRPVNVRRLWPEAAIDAFAMAGASADVARLYAEMYRAMDDGRVAWERPDDVWRGARTMREALAELM
ncbi:MAG TPA: NAD(P)H-binding protein [Myxococcota bacterium]|nr:NAD(P)H-binding protein [Myxococcota bacterium]